MADRHHWALPDDRIDPRSELAHYSASPALVSHLKRGYGWDGTRIDGTEGADQDRTRRNGGDAPLLPVVVEVLAAETTSRPSLTGSRQAATYLGRAAWSMLCVKG